VASIGDLINGQEVTWKWYRSLL